MMEFALIKRQGMMVLTGEVGTGKTMLMQHFISRLDGNHKIINISQTQLPELDFLQLLMLEIAQSTGEIDKRKLTKIITSKLEEIHNQGQHTIIIVDEAQNLGPEIIVRLHELSLVRIDNKKICTIYLVGQNSLQEKLDEPVVKEFIHNINARYHLGPLNLKDIRKYIYHRLAVAGGHKSVKFTKDVFAVFEAYTGGRPRLINVLADHILTFAYTEGIKGINAKVVDGAIADLQWLPFGVLHDLKQNSTDETFKQERRSSYKLIIHFNDILKGEFLLNKKRVSIGRHRENDLRIDDPLLSRQHAQIIHQGRTIYLRDLNSTNGTYVNLKRVDIAPLEEGTIIKAGNCKLTFLRNIKKTQEDPKDECVTDFAATKH